MFLLVASTGNGAPNYHLLGHPSPKKQIKVVDTLSNRKRFIEIKFRVNNDEKLKIDEKIKQAGIRRENYLREMAMDGTVFIQDLKHVDALIESIDRVGRNFNQIARHANEVQAISNNDLKDVKDRIEEIWRLLKLKLFENH